MLATERRSIILEEVSRQPSVSIRDLTERLGVSRETVRKDIVFLSEQGRLQQVRGGAVPVLAMEPPIADRTETNPEGKAAIAGLVMDRIPDGASVIIDSGSTTLASAKRLAAERKDLMIYTNDLRVAWAIGRAAREVVVLGGRLDPEDHAIYGIEAIEHLSRYRAEFALIGIGGLSESCLATDFSRETSALREQMMRQAEHAFVLADSSKFGGVSRIQVSLADNVTILSDCEPDFALSGVLEEHGIELITAR
ncbi:DeoR/GlpR family DNA-binding transcription regulator [Coralliovum pocilloporae]|uniref:DeoR/GlpR family DNA-binding transcription regulator n=1 Tax=Coralliovum pocilloporae TaxID=3066369 RepID=UPI003306A7D0